jgi:small subunit ribosomal protein S1
VEFQFAAGLQGDLAVLQTPINIEGKISSQGIEFTGSLKNPGSFAGFSVGEFTLSFSTLPDDEHLFVDLAIDLPGNGGLTHIHGIYQDQSLVFDANISDWQPISGLVCLYSTRMRVASGSMGRGFIGRLPFGKFTEAGMRLYRNTRLWGKVTNIADYGCFVEIEEGVEGLVHVSEMDWTNKNVNPAKVVHVGQEVEVMVLDIDEERRRISLGVKQCKTNPWKEFAENYNRGDKVSGQIKSITDFGIFIGLAGGIDGLVHLSDISWDMPGEEAVRSYQKAQQVDAMVLSIDPERERISLGIKQLAKDPFSAYIAEHPKGSIVVGVVREVDAKGAIIDLGNGVDGQLRASDLSRDRVEDARLILKVGQEVEAKFTGVDRKGRSISLSIKAKDIHEEQEAMQNYRTDSPTGTSLGDLLKEQISGQD